MITHNLRATRAGRWLALSALIALISSSTIVLSSATNKDQPLNYNDAMEDVSNKVTGEGVEERLVSANTRFAFKLFSEVAKQDSGKNVFISPASVGLALAMTYNGAVGDTKKAMERALEIQGLNHADLNSGYAQLKPALENPDPKVALAIANSLWAKRGTTFNPAFIQRNKQFYGAEVTELDFGDPGALRTINAWVADKTKGKISKIVDRINGQSILFLINAIYFKGTWTAEFDKAKTKEEDFTTAAGRVKRQPMMHQSGRYRYHEGKDFQAVSLPYGGGRVSMYIILPAKGISLAEFQKNLTAPNWDAWLKEFSEIKGDIALPRFKVEYEIGLNDSLKALGMGVAFDPEKADFTGISEGSGNVFISQVKHKTFAEVNEEGTEAAAATSVEMTVTSMGPRPKNFRMIVDHPFFCAIRDNKTGTILFLGAIADPA